LIVAAYRREDQRIAAVRARVRHHVLVRDEAGAAIWRIPLPRGGRIEKAKAAGFLYAFVVTLELRKHGFDRIADALRGSGQAQPGQSKPAGWLTLRSIVASRATPICCLSARATACSAPHPPAGPP
jgi:hypothetical protein